MSFSLSVAGHDSEERSREADNLRPLSYLELAVFVHSQVAGLQVLESEQRENMPTVQSPLPTGAEDARVEELPERKADFRALSR